MASIVYVCVLVVNELVVFLVNGEVGQMSKLGTFAKSGIILLTREPCQAFIINVNSPRIHGGDTHVETQVELEAVNQQWIGYVPTNYTVLVDGDL